jgi:hypothetical protein
MALVIPPGFAQAAWRFSLAGDAEVMVTTIGLEVAPQTNQQAADEFADLWLSQFPAGNMALEWKYLGAVLRVGTGGAPVIVEAPRNVSGTGAGQSPPSNCALLVKKRTALGGRSGRGRMFVPVTSVGEGGISPTGQIESSIVAALQGAWTAMFGEMSFFLFHDAASPVLSPTAITSLLVDPKLATQRRRMRS